jgi:hypothetical protein
LSFPPWRPRSPLERQIRRDVRGRAAPSGACGGKLAGLVLILEFGRPFDGGRRDLRRERCKVHDREVAGAAGYLGPQSQRHGGVPAEEWPGTIFAAPPAEREAQLGESAAGAVSYASEGSLAKSEAKRPGRGGLGSPKVRLRKLVGKVLVNLP